MGDQWTIAIFVSRGQLDIHNNSAVAQHVNMAPSQIQTELAKKMASKETLELAVKRVKSESKPLLRNNLVISKAVAPTLST